MSTNKILLMTHLFRKVLLILYKVKVIVCILFQTEMQNYEILINKLKENLKKGIYQGLGHSSQHILMFKFEHLTR